MSVSVCLCISMVTFAANGLDPNICHAGSSWHLYIKLPRLSVCVSVFWISQKRADRFPWNFLWFIGVIGRRERIKTSGKFRPLICKNWENGAIWPILRKSARATSAGLRNGLRSARTHARWPTSVRANRARAWGRCRTVSNAFVLLSPVQWWLVPLPDLPLAG